jgi:hypothetical protein
METIETSRPWCRGDYLGMIVTMGGLGRADRWVVWRIEYLGGRPDRVTLRRIA